MSEGTLFLKKNSDGFTLLEFMLSAALSSTIALILCVYYSLFTKLHLDIIKQYSQLEDLRFAAYFFYDCIDKSRKSDISPVDKVTRALMRVKKGTEALQIQQGDRSRCYFYLSEKEPSRSALFYKETGKPRLEIADNVDQLSIFYGIKCVESDNVCFYLQEKQFLNHLPVRSVFITFKPKSCDKASKPWSVYGVFGPH